MESQGDVEPPAQGKGKAKGKSKGAPPPPAAGAGPRKAAPVPIKLKCADPNEKAGRPKVASRLHLSAAQQLVAAQDEDGHFEAGVLAVKLDRLWTKLMVAMPPAEPKLELSGDPVDATVFVLLVFDLFVERSGCSEEKKRLRTMAWFGKTGLLRDQWLSAAESWLTAREPGWRKLRAETVQVVVEKWFATDGDCRQSGSFIDDEQLQACQAEISEKFASSHIESLRREELWTHNTPAAINAIPWEQASAVRWCFGGGGGAFLARFGSAKLLVKQCQNEGDVLAHGLAQLVQVRVAAMRLIPVAAPEFEVARRSLEAAQPDEQDHGQRLAKTLSKLRQAGAPLMVMEFVEGDSLQGRLGSEALKAGEETFMRAIGRLVALDCFINNYDRMPAVRLWPSAGNLGNVLVTPEGEAVGIDQTVQLLVDSKTRVEYLHGLRSFAEEVRRDALDGESLRRLRQAVQRQVMRWTGNVKEDAELYERFLVRPDVAQGVALADSACRFLVAGVREVFDAASALRAELKHKKSSLVGDCVKQFSPSKEEHSQLARRSDACLEFVDECMAVVESERLYKEHVEAAGTKNYVSLGRPVSVTMMN